MKITFLGTGTSQGIPVITCECQVCTSSDSRDQRLRTSILVETEDLTIAIDAGPDFRQQMLLSKVKKLDAVCITHEHNDHIIGLDDIRPFNFRAKKDMEVYATKRVQKILLERFAYVFAPNPYPGAPRVQLNTIEKQRPFSINDLKIIPIEVNHGQLPVLGFRIGDFTYITDAKTIDPEEYKKIEGSKILVINALRHQEHHSHLSLDQALAIIEDIQPDRAFLIHLSHLMGLTKDVEKRLPKNVQIAYDMLELTI